MASLEPERLLPGLQLSIRAFYMLSRDAAFASARGQAEARRAVEVWKRQCVMDDVTGESLLPTESAIKVCVRWIICGAYLWGSSKALTVWMYLGMKSAMVG